MPKALMSRPEPLDFRLGWYFRAFNRLSRSRDVSMGGPLPLKASEILAYCNLFEIKSINEREQLFDHIANLDDVYLKHVQSQKPEPAKDPPAKAA